MMRLSTMWAVDRTVDGDWRSPVAERILERWVHAPGSARFVRSSANFVYTFRQGEARPFLRFAAGSERTRAAVEAEAALVAWLAAEGVPVARPLVSRSGALVETVATAWGPFHAVVCARLEGEEREGSDLDTARIRAWGAALGRLHTVMARYSGATASRPSWREQLQEARALVSGATAAVQAEGAALAAELERLPETEDLFGLIHGDFQLDNLRWQGDGIAVLDFDGCARHWYAADIAMALRDLDADGVPAEAASVRAFLDGYTTEHALDPEIEVRLPVFRRVAAFVEYAGMLRALDLEVEDGHPDWLKGLVGKLQERMRRYEAGLRRG